MHACLVAQKDQRPTPEHNRPALRRGKAYIQVDSGLPLPVGRICKVRLNRHVLVSCVCIVILCDVRDKFVFKRSAINISGIRAFWSHFFTGGQWSTFGYSMYAFLKSFLSFWSFVLDAQRGTCICVLPLLLSRKTNSAVLALSGQLYSWVQMLDSDRRFVWNWGPWTRYLEWENVFLILDSFKPSFGGLLPCSTILTRHQEQKDQISSVLAVCS